MTVCAKRHQVCPRVDDVARPQLRNRRHVTHVYEAAADLSVSLLEIEPAGLAAAPVQGDAVSPVDPAALIAVRLDVYARPTRRPVIVKVGAVNSCEPRPAASVELCAGIAGPGSSWHRATVLPDMRIAAGTRI